jgi:hypothetical protein
MEQCYGCGIAAKDAHPMVAVGKFDAVAAVVPADPRGFNGVSICTACWQDPDHRMLHPVIKGTFFRREDVHAAIRLADQQNVVGSFVKA